MEALAPPHRFLLDFQLRLMGGISVRVGLEEYLAEFPEDSFTAELRRWFRAFECGAGGRKEDMANSYRRSIVTVLEMGLNGEPILERLKELEIEVELAANQELDRYIKRLPFLCMIPCLGLQFPALLILLFGPLLSEFFMTISQ